MEIKNTAVNWNAHVLDALSGSSSDSDVKGVAYSTVWAGPSGRSDSGHSETFMHCAVKACIFVWLRYNADFSRYEKS